MASSTSDPSPGHHKPAPERVPEVRVGQHPADFGGRDERLELDPATARASAVGLRAGQGGPGARGRAEADVWEDVPVGAHGRTALAEVLESACLARLAARLTS